MSSHYTANRQRFKPTAVRRACRVNSRRRSLAFEQLEFRRVLAAVATELVVDDSLYEGDRILVRLRDDVPCSQYACAGLVDGLNTRLEASYSALGNIHSVKLGDGVNLASALQSFASHPGVLYAEPDYQVHVTAVPNDPQFDALWGLNNTGQTDGLPGADIDAVEAWDQLTGSGQTVVAVIDTGVDYTHPDLADNIWVNVDEIPGDGIDNDGNGYIDDVHGYDFYNNDSDPMDDNHHGTHVAGTIGAVGNNGIGIAGVNWNVQIMALKFLGANGSGGTSAAVAAINYAVANGATISNNSWGYNGNFSQALYDAIAAARDADHIFLAAAGNGNIFGLGQNNDTNPFFPANIDLDNVVSVAALDAADERATFSNFGATTVDVGAPGVGILSTTPDNTYSTFSGTSMATPHVAGVVALMRDLHPDWTAAQVIDRLFGTAEPVAALQGITTTGGRINALAALLPDTFGAQVIATDPSVAVGEKLSEMRIQFDEVIDPSSFTAEDIVSLVGPLGSEIGITSVTPIAATANRQFLITFPEQVALGEYTLVLGPNILDGSGNPMDQDDDGINGEPVEDRFSTSITVVPFLKQFDFGTSTSPVAKRSIKTLTGDVYDPVVGYGYQTVSTLGIDRGIGSATDRDLHYGPALTYLVDAPNARYDVTLTLGDKGQYAHEQMAIYLEGVLVDTISTAAGEVVERVYENVAISDGQLTLVMQDLGGSDANVVINGLEVVYAGPDDSGAYVTAFERVGGSTDPLERFVLSFNEAIDAGSFSSADASLTGPTGTITASDVQPISDTEFEVFFEVQTAIGNYEFTAGPQILDLAGNPLDQDRDDLAGELIEDRFTAQLSLVPVADQRFDFGTGNSPTAIGFTQITPATAYSAATGYGFQGGPVYGMDRANASAVDRDFAYANSLTFDVDLPNANYDVRLRVGDTGFYAHDLMVISLEGVQLATVDTAGGQVLELLYENVAVNDGRLTLHMQDLGGDPNVVLNGLEVIYRGPDTSGPVITAAQRLGTSTDPLDRILLTFNEPLDPASFTVADVVSLNGPLGPIFPSDVQPISDTQFAVLFATQTEPGDYQISVGPQILDVAGNAMDQDQDGTLGESLDDRFIGQVAILPVADQYFDFGTGNSPVASGYQRVTPSTLYSAETGYGFQTGSVAGLDRANAADLERDFVYASDLTYAVDLPNAKYTVTLWVGDSGIYAHDQMAIFLEGAQLATVNSAAGQVLELVYENVAVNDGQLTLRMQDLGGDPNVVLNGLEITYAGPDDSGPFVTSIDRLGNSTDPLDRILVTFNEPLDPASFSLADIVSLSGPLGSIAASEVLPINDTQFAVLFDEQVESGNYQLVIGPQILDVTGNPMDQDRDGVTGELPDDRFVGEVSIVPVADQRFDFGTGNSPVAEGYLQITPATAYSPATGYGFQAASVAALDRANAASLERDFVYANSLTYAVDLPNAEYRVTVRVGDTGFYAHDQMALFLEGIQMASLDTAGGQVLELVYEHVNVKDGQLTLHMQDLGGGDPNVVLNGLEIVYSGPDQSGPAILTVSPASQSLSPIDRLGIVFNEPVDPASFDLSDVVVTNPLGTVIPVTAINSLSETEFEILIPAQTELGVYGLVVGPDIRDPSGYGMDQDGDGISGESVQDRWVSQFELVEFTPQAFDFGTNTSPLEPGHVRVSPGSTYTSAAGFGWSQGAVFAVDRGAGTDLTRDLIYSADATFSVDIPNGLFDLTITMGDTGRWSHDAMGVFVEGTLVDTVSTPSWQTSVMVYENILIADGQLTLRLQDLGGADANIVINGLHIAAASSSTMTSTASFHSPPTLVNVASPSPNALSESLPSKPLPPLQAAVQLFSIPAMTSELENVVSITTPVTPARARQRAVEVATDICMELLSDRPFEFSRPRLN